MASRREFLKEAFRLAVGMAMFPDSLFAGESVLPGEGEPSRWGYVYSSGERVLYRWASLDPSRYPLEILGRGAARYLGVGTKIACEFCCGAEALVFVDGSPACGCVHAAGMRGVLGYLSTNYPHIPQIETLREVAKWKWIWFKPWMSLKILNEIENGMKSLDVIVLAKGREKEIRKEVREHLRREVSPSILCGSY